MGFQIPCLLGDTKNTEGVPKSLGDLTRGCQILGGAGSPMTLAPVFDRLEYAKTSLVPRLSWNANIYRTESLVRGVRHERNLVHCQQKSSLKSRNPTKSRNPL